MHLNIPYLKTKFTSVLKRGLLYAAYFIIFIAILSSIFRAFTPMAARYRPQLEQLLSSFIGQPVHIQSIETGWYWFKPVLKANQLVVQLPQHQQLNVQQLQLGINLLSSLIHLRIQPGVLLIDGMTLHIVETDLGWQIQDIDLKPNAQANSGELERILSFVLAHDTIQVKHIQLDAQLKSLPLLKLRDMDATLVYRFGKHRMRGQVSVDSISATPIEFGAEVVLNSINPEKLFGHVYLGIKGVNVEPWLKRLPNFPLTVKQGVLGAQIWGELAEGQFIAAQTRFDLAQVEWKEKHFSDVGRFKHLKGNLAWRRTKTGVQVTGDELELVDEHGDWPQTAFSLEMNGTTHDWDLYLKQLDIKTVLNLPFTTSAQLQAIQQAHVTGMLSDTHVVQHQGAYHALTQFTDVSWRSKNGWPGVKHLSGVINWEPLRGHLKLQSQDVAMKVPAHASLQFKMVNLDLIWQQTQGAWSFDLAHVALDHPDLKLNGQGKLTQVSTGHPGLLDVHAEFALKQGEKWIPFLPKSSLKPKLYRWLSHDIHEIQSGVGSLLVQGDLAHFPFEHGQGRFHIETTLEGVKLNFAKGWPAAEDTQAHLEVNQRNLSAHITHAKIGGADVGPLYLTVNDLGLDKERLLLHGLAEAPAEVAWPIVLAAPLGQKNPFLSEIHWKGPVALDLQLDIPLFVGDDELLILGKVDVLKNHIYFKQPLFSVGFNQVKGVLHFDRHGLLPSHFKTMLWGHAVPLDITGEAVPNRISTLHLQTQVDTVDLFKVFYLKPLKGISGHIQLDANMLLSSDEKTLTLKSPLKGLELDFLPLLQKKKMDIKPFEASFFFASSPSFTATLHYADALKLKRTEKGAWEIKSTLPALNAQLVYHPADHQLSGVIQSLSIPEKWASTASTTWNINPSDLPSLDLQIQQLHYGELLLGQFSMKAKTVGQTWRVNPWRLQSSVDRTEGSAAWTKTPLKQSSHLQFDYETKDISQSLKAWQVSPALEKGKMTLHAELNWNDALWSGKLATMRGEVTTKVTEGRTMNFSKQTESKLGLAKLLSVFSLQTLPRRLKLDFSDLSHDGYSFDVFDGSFQLAKGVLQTTACTIDGPVASADIQGRIDVVQHLYDLSIRVSPHLTSSLPVVAMIAGGPIAGVATLVASNILNRSFQKMTSYTYRVTGPWKDPVVEPFRLSRGKE
ncbi:MAG: DUF3971 domain-containing protein [Gammaproteobacteria bacterium]|nr:DUF3971 domain-containing protein [Gammaproteobacteria bacterium]